METIVVNSAEFESNEERGPKSKINPFPSALSNTEEWKCNSLPNCNSLPQSVPNGLNKVNKAQKMAAAATQSLPSGDSANAAVRLKLLRVELPRKSLLSKLFHIYISEHFWFYRFFLKLFYRLSIGNYV